MTSLVPENDGCPWPIDPACLEDQWESTFDEPTKTRAIALASNTLRRLTGFRVGGCPVTIRPCSNSCVATYVNWSSPGTFLPAPFVPVNWNGTWHNSCGCSGSCGHDTPGKVVVIPGLVSVDEVHVDGTLLTAGTDYWVDGRRVIRLGTGTWPISQDLNLPPGQPNTFTIRYFDSYPVDGQGAYAAAKLAMQYAKACTSGKCDLPATVTQVVRQGVSYSLPAGSFPNGETGIREVDAYIALWNPSHRRTRIQVWAP